MSDFAEILNFLMRFQTKWRGDAKQNLVRYADVAGNVGLFLLLMPGQAKNARFVSKTFIAPKISFPASSEA